MCLRQPFQLLTSSPVPVKDNTCNKNETFAANNEKTKQQQQQHNGISAIKKKREKDGNKQTNKVTKQLEDTKD